LPFGKISSGRGCDFSECSLVTKFWHTVFFSPSVHFIIITIIIITVNEFILQDYKKGMILLQILQSIAKIQLSGLIWGIFSIYWGKLHCNIDSNLSPVSISLLSVIPKKLICYWWANMGQNATSRSFGGGQGARRDD
jgi:hypothetical protein